MHLIDHCWKYQNGTGVFRTEDGQEFHDFFSYAELAGMKINAPEPSRIQNCSGLIQKTTLESSV